MIKSIILTSFFVAFAFIAMPASNANACATCGCAGGAEHSHADKAEKKPCTKCAEAKAHYAKTGKKKPCSKCAEAKAHYDKKAEKMPTRTRVYDGYSNKGSLTLQSGTSFKSKASAGYND